MFRLNVGDVCKLKEIIPGIYQSYNWKTGLYRVESISPSVCSHPRDYDKPEFQVYNFRKIKQDGTVYPNFINGYRCMAWDEMIQSGQVEIVYTGTDII